jgi:hypothetical protein
MTSFADCRGLELKNSLDLVRIFRTARVALAALALSLPLTPMGSFAQEVPASRPGQTATAEQGTTSTRIVLVEWRIKKGREDEFLEYWSTRATIADRSGLVGEFLSRVESQKQFPWMVWGLDPRWTTFVNVGFWRDGADFQQQIGRFIDNSKPSLAFEAQKRRRVFVAPERWRIGASPLILSDHPSVR